MADILTELLAKLSLDADDFTKGIDKSTGSLTGFSGFIDKVSARIFSPAGLVGALAAVGGASFAAALEFDKAIDEITIKTGTGGTVLAGLEDSFKRVFAQVPNDAAQVATALSDLNVKLGLTGAPLETMAVQFLTLSRLMKEDIGPLITTTANAFLRWGVETKDQAATLEYFRTAAVASKMSVTELAGSLISFQPVLTAIGLDLRGATEWLGAMRMAGVDIDTLMPALSKSISAMAKAGIDPSVGFPALVARIRDAESGAKALEFAGAEFGTKGGLKFIEAVRTGALESGNFANKIAGVEGTIASLAAKTDDFGEHWKATWHSIEILIEPIGMLLMKLLDGFVMTATVAILAAQGNWKELKILAEQVQKNYEAQRDAIPVIKESAAETAQWDEINKKWGVTAKANIATGETATEATKRQTAAVKAAKEEQAAAAAAAKKAQDEENRILDDWVKVNDRAAQAEFKRYQQSQAAEQVERDYWVYVQHDMLPLSEERRQSLLAYIAAQDTLLKNMADQIPAMESVNRGTGAVIEPTKELIDLMASLGPAGIASFHGITTAQLEFTKALKDDVGGAFDDLLRKLVSGDMSFGETMKKMWQDLAFTCLEKFLKPVKDAITDFIAGTLADLLSGKGLGGVLDSLKGIGSAVGGIFGGGGGAAGTAAGASGSAGSAAGGVGSAASGAASGVFGAVMGIANLGVGIASGITSGVLESQMADRLFRILSAVDTSNVISNGTGGMLDQLKGIRYDVTGGASLGTLQNVVAGFYNLVLDIRDVAMPTLGNQVINGLKAAGNTFNIYPSAGMDEMKLADIVVDKLRLQLAGG